MLSKKSMKIISTVVLVVMLLMTIGTTVFAVVVPTPSDVEPDSSVTTTVGKILGIIQWAGIVTAVVIAMFIGIKYITASPEGKAEIKKTLIFYVGGMVLLLSASAIVTFVQVQLTAPPVQ